MRSKVAHPAGMKASEDRDTGYHTPVWPPYIVAKGKEPHRLLCALSWSLQRDTGASAAVLLTEHGERVVCQTWEALCEWLFEQHALVFCGSLPEALAPWQEQIAQETKGTRDGRAHRQWCEWTVAPAAQILVSLVIHRHPKSCKLVWSGTWGGRIADGSLLADLRWVYDALDVGDYATPAALGAACMGALWRKEEGEERNTTRHHRPPSRCVAALQKYAVGARKEAYSPLEAFDSAWELDRSNGYAAEVGELPSGTTRYVPDGTRWLHPDSPDKLNCFTWWAQCYVRIDAPGLPVGARSPFAVRAEESDELTWPTAPGGYLCWLWQHTAEEIERLRRDRGWPIHIEGIGEGWYWDGSTRQLRQWALQMDAVRTIAKSRGPGGMNDKHKADLVKVAIVGAIGRLGMDYTRVSVVPEEEAVASDVPLSSQDAPDTGLYIRTEPVDAAWPKHWHAYILDRMNLNIWQAMREEESASGLLPAAVNTDGVIYGAEPASGVAPDRVALGGYKKTAIGWAAAPAPGILIAEGKLATPGLDRFTRERIMRYGEQGVGGRGYETERQRSKRQAAGSLRAQLEHLRQLYLARRESG